MSLRMWKIAKQNAKEETVWQIHLKSKQAMQYMRGPFFTVPSRLHAVKQTSESSKGSPFTKYQS